MPTPVAPTRSRRLLTVLLYAGCAGAAVFILRPLVSAEPASVASPSATRPPSDIDPFVLPPGHWSVLSAERLEDIARQVRGEAVPPRKKAACPLLPPGVDPLAERFDTAGRVSAFVTAAEEWVTFEKHWISNGWMLTDTEAADSTRRAVALHRGGERGLAWTFAAREPGRVHLLVTIHTQHD